MSDLEKLRELSDAATAGPWRADASDPTDVVLWAGDKPGRWLANVGAWSGDDTHGPTTDEQAEADAAFIVAAVNYVRTILSQPETLDAAWKEAEADWPHRDDGYGHCETCHPNTPENDHPDGGCNALGEPWPCAAERLRLKEHTDD